MRMTEHIMMIEFTKVIGGEYSINLVALFNDTKISEAEVRRTIKAGSAEYSDDIVLMTKKQYESLCGE